MTNAAQRRCAAWVCIVLGLIGANATLFYHAQIADGLRNIKTNTHQIRKMLMERKR